MADLKTVGKGLGSNLRERYVDETASDELEERGGDGVEGTGG